MNNLPATREFSSVPELVSQGQISSHKVSLLNYSNLILFSVCIMLIGVVVGLEQGRKPLWLSMKEQAAAAALQVKVSAITENISANFKPSEGFQDFRIVPAAGGLEIHFGTSAMFGTGQASISQATEAELNQMAKLLFESSKDAQITIESYTDDAPMAQNSWHYPTNWELSGARAARLLRVFHAVGYPVENLTFVGFGKAHPLLPNRDDKGEVIPENRMRNRRVVIRISSL